MSNKRFDSIAIPGSRRFAEGRWRKAQMPFSVAAVLLLVLSGFSIALIYQADLREGSNPIPLEIAREMSRTADEISFDLQEVAYSKAIDSVRASNDINESAIMARFSSSLSEHVRMNYPRGVDGLLVRANTSNATLVFMRTCMEELYPELEGDYSSYNLTTVPAYFAMAGNITIVVEGYGGMVIQREDLETGLYLPFPLLANRIGALAEALSGGRCEFENIVRYELSALAQDRVLRGYGLRSKQGAMGTSEVITEEDVLRAMNLALLLEQRKHLRSLDPSLTSWMEGQWQGDSSILNKSLRGGQVDPADLLLSSYGSLEYDMGLILAQSLFAISDILVLKWLESLHVLDLIEGLETLLETGELSLNGLIESCFGMDLLQEEMIEWISERMAEFGYLEESYRYLHFNAPDGKITVSDHPYSVVNDLNQTYALDLGGEYEVDFPSVDIFSSSIWGDFLEEWKRSSFQLGDTLSLFLKQVVLGIISHFGTPSVQMDLDPLDGESPLDRLMDSLGSILEQDWFTSVLEEAEESVGLVDVMSEELCAFMDAHWRDILSTEESLEAAITQVVQEMVNETSDSIPHMGERSKRMMELELRSYFTSSTTWNLMDVLEVEYQRASSWRLEAMRDVFAKQVFQTSFGQISSLLSDLISGSMEGLPGLEGILAGYVQRQMSQIKDSFELRCDRIVVPVPKDSGFTIMLRDCDMQETIQVDANPLVSEGSDRIEIGIMMPWDHPRNDFYPNTHMTELTNLSLVPYVTQWTVQIQGDIRLSASSIESSNMFLGAESPSCEKRVRISTEFTIAVNTGWALQGVDYSPTSTLMGKVTSFMEGIWNGIVDALKFVANGITAAFDFFKDMFSTLLSYSMKGVEYLSQVLQAMVSGLQGILKGAAGTAFDLMGKFVESVLGTVEFNTTVFGLRFSVETNPVDLALGKIKDILKVTFSMSVMGTTISMANRLVRLGNGEYDILINCTLGQDEWSLSIVVDPLMKIFSHFVEIKGIFSDLVLLLYLPEVVQYTSHMISLKDIPGLGALLSNIPTPIPGVKASIDAGLEVKFNSPFVNHLVINEYEQNPAGLDNGNEWIEIYNPTDRAISLKDWSVETSHGNQRLEDLTGVSIMPHERVVYTFKHQALDNGGRVKFPICESIVLKDASGNRVDSTPWTTDHYNDGRSWQRVYDGADRWVFKEATKGSTNGKMMVTSSEIDFITRTIWDSAARAFSEAEGVEPSLESLGYVFSRTVDLIMEKCIDVLASSIVEMRLYVEVSLNEYSGSFGGGFSLSLVITENCVRETLSLIGDMICKALLDVKNPLGITSQTSIVERLAEHIFIRFSVFGRAGLPGMVSSVIDTPEFRLESMVSINLACVGSAFGFDIGAWKIEFGVAITGIPAVFLPNLFAVDVDKKADVWLVKGMIFAS
ncbi:MAG: lamin tail domain-containing protein [Methanomassiliicoccales archaeon]|nr:lamin tail domain-containing protein [Methanomassiliicoccales archaeon]